MNEEQKNQEKYFLGLDIGTDSVGWCVTDRNYNIVRKQGKHLWGSRLFEEAQDASSRRSARASRRRLERRRWRILMLQDIFKDEVNKVDPSFFDRLNNSALHEEDKPELAKAPCLLFNDKDYSDCKYYTDYPTIYHLRKEMIENPEKKYDIRMIYLVMAHMIKYRGNFLREGSIGDIGNDTQTVVDLFNTIDGLLDSLAGEDDLEPVQKFNCTTEIAKNLIDLFKSDAGKSLLLEQAQGFFKLPKGKTGINAILALICGSTRNLKDVFLSDEEDSDCDIKADFNDATFVETTLLALPGTIGDDKAAIIKTAKDIYDYRILANILQGKKYISEAMVDIYQKHNDQLKELKDLVKRYAPNKYAEFFRQVFDKKTKNNTPLKNYSNYVGFCNVKNKNISVAKTTSQEELYKAIKAILPIDKVDSPDYVWKEPGDKEKFSEIRRLMDAQKYLPRQNSKDNGVLPYQLNEIEMNKIIDNQKQYYPFLGNKDKDYLNPNTQSYKLDSLLKFKIPYYVGPLSNDVDPKTGKQLKNHWIVKKDSNVKITPWNFNDVIDKEKTEEAFIENLKNSCTYLIDEPTLPKNSLLYSEFTVLNEMNNWIINGQPITTEDKNYLINNVYLTKKKPTLASLQAALKEKYKTDVQIFTRTGSELNKEDIHANMSSWIDMSNPKGFGANFFKDEKKKALAEEIIYTITIFDDHKVVSERLEKYNLTSEQKRYFSSLPYTGWGKLSQKFLDGLTVESTDVSTGEVKSYTIMDLLRTTNQNLMEIYETGDKANGFKKQVLDINKSKAPTEEDIIENEYTAPSMKRSLRQTLKVVNELKEILKIDSFDSYFVECTRTVSDKDKKKRTLSRKKQLSDVYASAKAFASQTLKNQLEAMTDDKLRSKKYFLYFMQMGKSVYTGAPIELDEIEKNYDIDHIIPQAKVKDDSFTNTVLVEKGVNNRKQDNYPIPESCLTADGRKCVETLSTIKFGDSYLMPKAKKDRILRSTNQPLTEDEEVGFVNRQLTMTDQSVKAVCDVLAKTDEKAHIVYSKANLVSDFRKAFDLLKCRDVNDFHHANDAYLNIVVGNVYNKTFSSVFNKTMLEQNKAYFETMKLNAETFFHHDHTIFMSDTKVWISKHYDRVDNQTWVEDKNSKGTIDLVRKYMSYNDPLVTQMLFTQTGKQGFFNKISIHPVYDQGSLMPLKATGPMASDGWEKKYGGYNDLTAPYFMLVQSDISKGKYKGKHQYSLENIPSVYKAKFDDKEWVKDYLTKERGLVNPAVILPKLLIRTVIEYHSKDENGKDIKCRVGISCKSLDTIHFVNLNELMVDKIHSDYIRVISKLLGTNLPANANKPDLSIFKDSKEIRVGQTTISSANNEEMYHYLVDYCFKKPCIYMIPGVGSTIQKLSLLIDTFKGLDLIKQCKTLIQMVSMCTCKTRNVDLTTLGLSKTSAIVRGPKFLSFGTKIIAQSITGFYEKVLFTVPDKEGE